MYIGKKVFLNFLLKNTCFVVKFITMAINIKAIPVLEDREAECFVDKAEIVYNEHKAKDAGDKCSEIVNKLKEITVQ